MIATELKIGDKVAFQHETYGESWAQVVSFDEDVVCAVYATMGGEFSLIHRMVFIPMCQILDHQPVLPRPACSE